MWEPCRAKVLHYISNNISNLAVMLLSKALSATLVGKRTTSPEVISFLHNNDDKTILLIAVDLKINNAVHC